MFQYQHEIKIGGSKYYFIQTRFCPETLTRYYRFHDHKYDTYECSFDKLVELAPEEIKLNIGDNVRVNNDSGVICNSYHFPLYRVLLPSGRECWAHRIDLELIHKVEQEEYILIEM